MHGIRVALLGLCLGGLGGCSTARSAAGSDAGAARADLARRTGTEVAVLGAAGDARAAVADLLRQPLTEQAAVKVALLQNASVRETYERLGVARADLLQAGLLRNPVFAVDAKAFAAGPEIELALAQPFVDLFFVPLRRRVAGHELRAVQCAVVRDLVRLVYDVRRAFVRAQSADALVAWAGEALTRANASRDLMNQLHAAGNALDTVRTLEETDAARAQLDLDAARLAAAEAREPLHVLLGLEGSPQAWTLAGTAPEQPPPSPAGDAVAQALAASLDLLESRARIDAALCRAGLVRREGAVPELDVGVVGKQEAGGAWGFGPSFSTALPVFDAGQARVASARAELRGRIAHHEHLAAEVRSAARLLAGRTAALAERARYLEAVYLPLRERLVREGLQFFNAMQIGAFDVLRAKRQELDARREHAETLRELWLARLDLAELLAGSLDRERLEPSPLPAPAEHPDLPKGH